ncbi:hypothetical protein R1sor_023616 [Riccia sorocarpa]|uniref:Acetyl-coenzyme A transporter 1 n=1 Tax=Riccia sorocarpa TaxID=122646 RepID=A0ABD3GRD2_9MARC
MASVNMHKRSRSSQQMTGMEEGSPFLSSSTSTEWDPNSMGSSDTAVTDVFNMALLVMLYAMQGVPLGLSLGSIPFILKSQASYTEVGIFSLAGYPYSLKLLWSPVVDTVFSAKLGWRKSWVLPMQMASGLLMIFSAETAEYWLEAADIRSITTLFLIFVLLAATQDIAVDGWALTLLSRKNVGHASTCQTVGMNSGYFLSFTIFLALNDVDFCNKYLRSSPSPKGILSLSNYFYFWGWFYVVTTVLLLYKSEKPFHNTHISTGSDSQLSNLEPRFDASYKALDKLDSGDYQGQGNFDDNGKHRSTYEKKGLGVNERKREGFKLPFGHGSSNDKVAGTIRQIGVRRMYRRLWAVLTLPNIRSLSFVLLVCKLGSVTAEAVGVFKLMEKGVTREMVSLVVLIEFPLELLFAVFAGKWASRGRPFSPWVVGYYMRLGMAAISTCLVALFPVGATISSAPFFYIMIIVCGILTSFASTIMFVSQGTFFARISDSSMGGTYLTLLNTIANLGSAWPRFFIFILLDWLTVQECVGVGTGDGVLPLACPTRKGSFNPCTNAGGTCKITSDGFYPLSFAMILLGAFIGYLCRKRLSNLETAKVDAWRA